MLQEHINKRKENTVLSLVISLAIAGEVPGEVPNASEEKPPVEESKIVCRSVWSVSSRIPQRICRTKKAWAKIAEANQKQLQNQSNYSRGTQNRN